MVHHSGGNLSLTLTSRFASIFLIHKHFDSVVTEGHLRVAWSRQGEVLNFPRRRWKAILNQRDVSSAHSLKADSSSILGQSELLCAQTQNNLFNTGSWELVKFFFFFESSKLAEPATVRLWRAPSWNLPVLAAGHSYWWVLSLLVIISKIISLSKRPNFYFSFIL